MKNFLKEFKEFIATGNLVELAVAFILALAIKNVIDAFMAGIVNPIIGAIVGKPNLDNFMNYDVRNGAIVRVGVVLTQIISLIIVGLVLFLALKAYNKLRKPADEAPAGPSEVELLTQIRDELRSRP